MTEKPIIMTPESVGAILNGQKTQTRRVITPPPNGDFVGWTAFHERAQFRHYDGSVVYATEFHTPKARPGDTFWVREWCEDPTPARSWNSPLFMPKKFARIWLGVSSIKVHRIQDIVPDDVVAEGYGDHDDFRVAWDRINFDRGYGWAMNPWVFAYVFSVIRVGGDIP